MDDCFLCFLCQTTLLAASEHFGATVLRTYAPEVTHVVCSVVSAFVSPALLLASFPIVILVLPDG